MRRVLLLTILAVPVSATPAHAQTATLWGCHGPDGRALPFSYSASGTVETAITEPGGGCSAPGGTIRIAFTRDDPAAGQHAALRFAAPTGVAVEGVVVGRSASGPGYHASGPGGPFETLATSGTLDGTFAAPAGTPWVELGLRCETSDPRCDSTGARVDLRHAAVSVRDAAAPAFEISELPAFAKGTVEVAVDAQDAGLGLASVAVTLAGAPVTTERLGQGRCAELSPGDPTTDLPLAEDCPASDRVIVALDTTAVADGTHPLVLAVADGAGNTTTRAWDLRVLNHPPGSVPGPPPPSTGGVATPPPLRPISLPGILRDGRRFTVSRDGMLTVEASCPRAATVACAMTLSLKAKLPGRKRTTTVATARSTAKPGRRARIHMRLSPAARSALRKQRTLRAELRLSGREPVRVTLVRSAR